MIQKYACATFNVYLVLCLSAWVSGCSTAGQGVKTGTAAENTLPSIAYINFIMPNQIEWVQHVNDRNDAGAIVAEWGMKNYSQSDTPLRIMYNRVVPTGTPLNFLNQLITPLKQNCTDTKITPLPSASQYSIQSGAEAICARLGQNGFGVLVKLYVFADKDAMHLVASEVKIPPSEKAGILNFNNDAEKQQVQNAQTAISILGQFMETVRVCTENNQCI